MNINNSKKHNMKREAAILPKPMLAAARLDNCNNSNGGLDYAVFEFEGTFGKTKIVIDNRQKPVRIQRSRKEKQVSPNGLPIVYVGRPTKFGNPFVINVLATRQDCVDNFELCTCSDNEYKRKVKQELKGKNLSCWCKVGEPCHADILLKIANS